MAILIREIVNEVHQRSQTESLLKECEELAKIISASILTLKGKR